MLAILKSGKFWFGVFIGVVLMNFLFSIILGNEEVLAHIIKENQELKNACVRAFFQ